MGLRIIGKATTLNNNGNESDLTKYSQAGLIICVRIEEGIRGESLDRKEVNKQN